MALGLIGLAVGSLLSAHEKEEENKVRDKNQDKLKDRDKEKRKYKQKKEEVGIMLNWDCYRYFTL